MDQVEFAPGDDVTSVWFRPGEIGRPRGTIEQPTHAEQAEITRRRTTDGVPRVVVTWHRIQRRRIEKVPDLHADTATGR